jgi:hypothetical protein
MPRCQFCDRDNPAGRRRCDDCGAELPESGGSGLVAAAANELEAEIADLLSGEGKIAAIKRYREATGAGLKESKEAVEELEQRLGVTPAAGAAPGCMVVLVALLATACLAFGCVVAGAGRWPW